MELLGQNKIDHHQRQVAILSQDSFYRVLTPEQKAKALKGQFNFDHPGKRAWKAHVYIWYNFNYFFCDLIYGPSCVLFVLPNTAAYCSVLLWAEYSSDHVHWCSLYILAAVCVCVCVTVCLTQPPSYTPILQQHKWFITFLLVLDIPPPVDQETFEQILCCLTDPLLLCLTDAFDNELIVKTLCDIMEGRTVQIPVYDFVTHSRSVQTTFENSLYGLTG